jgi:hypothetical protein
LATIRRVCRASGVNSDFGGEARAKSIEVRLACEQHDLDWNTLNNLGEVSSRVVGREKRELRSARWGDFDDFASECPIRQDVGMNICQSSHSNVRELCLLEVRLHPGRTLDKVNHVCTRRYQLPDKYVPFTDATVRWRRNAGIGEVDLGHDDCRFLCGDIRLIDIVSGIQRFPLPLRSLKFTLTGCKRTLSAR